MGYLILQMIFCLILAFVLGLILGWLLTRGGCSSRLALLEEKYKLQLEKLQAERNSNVNTPPEEKAVAMGLAGTVEPEKDYPVEEVEGIGPTYGSRLRSSNIETTDDLLNYCSGTSRQTEISEIVKVEPFVVAKWVSMSDLMRINGVEGQYAELLEASGIRNVEILAVQNGSDLAETMARVNEEEHRTPSVPSVVEVNTWIDQARNMSSKIVSLVEK